MTAPTAPVPATFAGPGIPLSRLVKVELRKLFDTRASFWLSASIAAITAVIAVTVLVVGAKNPQHVTLDNLFQLMAVPMGFLLPVLAIMLVTGEWSQRNALTTFTMEPRRERVILAKLSAVAIASVAAIVIALVLGALATLLGGAIYGDPAGQWNVTGTSLIGMGLTLALNVLVGFALASLLLSTPAAIVAYFVIPTALQIIGGLIPWFNDNLLQWVDINSAQSVFFEGHWPTGTQWAHIVVSAVVWIGVPLYFGLRRIVGTEIK